MYTSTNKSYFLGICANKLVIDHKIDYLNCYFNNLQKKKYDDMLHIVETKASCRVLIDFIHNIYSYMINHFLLMCTIMQVYVSACPLCVFNIYILFIAM